MMELSNNQTGEEQLILHIMVDIAKTCDTPIYGVSIDPDHVRKLKKPIAMNVAYTILLMNYCNELHIYIIAHAQIFWE